MPAKACAKVNPRLKPKVYYLRARVLDSNSRIGDLREKATYVPEFDGLPARRIYHGGHTLEGPRAAPGASALQADYPSDSNPTPRETPSPWQKFRSLNQELLCEWQTDWPSVTLLSTAAAARALSRTARSPTCAAPVPRPPQCEAPDSFLRTPLCCRGFYNHGFIAQITMLNFHPSGSDG